MSRQSRVGRNDPCPCMTGKKFKNCCSGIVDWEGIFREGRDYQPYLSVRGRNLYFTNQISDALQLNAPGKIRSLRDYKSAFTAGAVRKIYEAVMKIWSPDINILAALRRSPSDVSGLYIGDYSADYRFRGGPGQH